MVPIKSSAAPNALTELTPERIAEIKDLLRYESSIAFYSHLAKESMLLLVAGVEQMTVELQQRDKDLEPYEALNPQQCPAGLHADWLVDSEHTHACPWCRIAELDAASPWERAVAGLNALVDAKVSFWIEPDGHISGPFGDEHIEWDHDNTRWRLVHDDEDDDSHEAKVADYLATPHAADTGSAEAEALAAVDRSIAAQFPLLAALREAPHDAASKGASS